MGVLQCRRKGETIRVNRPTVPIPNRWLALAGSVIFLAVFARLLSPTGTLVFRDHLNYFLATKHFLAEGYRFWFGSNYLGVPAYGDPQLGFWYPPSLLFPLLPFPFGYNLFLVLHFLIIFLFAYLIGRDRFDGLTGLFLAVGVTLSGVVLGLSEFGSYFASFAWFFPLLWLLLRYRQTGRFRYLLWFPPVLFLALTPGGTLFFAVNLLVAVGALAWFSFRRRLAPRRALLVLLLTALFCYLPAFYYFELYLNSSLPLGYEHPGDFSFSLARLDKFISAPHNTWDRFLADPNTLFPFAYLGVVGAICFVLGVRSHPRIALLAILVLLSAAGWAGWPLLSGLFAFCKFRFPEKVLPYFVALFGLVAAGGFHRLGVKRGFKLVLLAVFFAELALVNSDYFVMAPWAELVRRGGDWNYPRGTRVMTIVSQNLNPKYEADTLEEHSLGHLRYKHGLAAAYYGMDSFLGYGPAKLAGSYRASQFFSFGGLTAVERTRLLRNLGIEYVFGKIFIDGDKVMERQAGWEPQFYDPEKNFQLYRLTGSLPPAYLVSEAQFRGMDSLGALATDFPFAPVGELVVGNDRVQAICRATAPGWLVVNRYWYPGMIATVSGRDAPVARAFGILAAVKVPAGETTVSITYRPTALVPNLLVFAATILWWLGLYRRVGGPAHRAVSINRKVL